MSGVEDDAMVFSNPAPPAARSSEPAGAVAAGGAR
jgi:hypothetical protein